MNASDNTLFLTAPARRRVRRWRIGGFTVLLLGLAGAGAVYWLGNRNVDFADDPSMLGFYKSETRQMGQLYGRQGVLIEDFENSLKQPGTQAVIILIAAGLIAGGIFYVARTLELKVRHAGPADKLEE